MLHTQYVVDVIQVAMSAKKKQSVKAAAMDCIWLYKVNV